MMTRWPLNYDNNAVTVELREVVESLDPDIKTARGKIWNFDYPSYYTGEQKRMFEDKVLDHYWFRQIGQETVGRWMHYFRSRMREIMPYYIQLYESEALMQGIDDPFGNIDITETFEEERTGQSAGQSSTTSETSSQTTGEVANQTTTDASSESTNTGASSSDTESETKRTHLNTHKFSNTPQGTIDNIEMYLTEGSIDDGEDTDDVTTSTSTETEATSTGSTTSLVTATVNTLDSGETTGTTSGTTSGTESATVRHTLTRKGNQGVNTYAHDMKELRETFLNIDMMIITELKDLFLQVY